jgi:hypothetical protein
MRASERQPSPLMGEGWVGVPVPQQKTVEKKNIRSQEAGSFH